MRHEPAEGPSALVMSDRRMWAVLAAVGIGTFMSALDSSVVNVALPVMRESLGASVAAIQWVVTVYLLVVSGTLLGFGRLGDLRGHKSIYLAGFAFFIGGSVLCANAWSEASLAAFRGVQALGAAMLFANSPAIITATFPVHRRGQALGLQATMTYLGLTLGPPLGGLLTRVFGWPAIFYINVPVGLAAVALTWFVVPNDPGKEAGAPFDSPGAAAFFAGLVGIMLALNQGHAWGWDSAATLGLLAASSAVLVAFVVRESRYSHPMLDLTLFRNTTFGASTLSALLNYVAIYTIVFIMPFYLIQGRGLPPDQAGLLLAVQSIVMAVSAPISGWASDKIGTRALKVAGMGTLAAGTAMLASLGSSAGLPLVTGALAVAGLGTGLFVSPNSSALMGAAPRHRLGIASGVLAEARNVGMVLGVGLAGAVFTTRLAGMEPGPHQDFFAAVRMSFAAATVVAVLAAVASAFGEQRRG